MPILINEYHQDHHTLPDAWAKDERLSYKARGLLWYLHTLPPKSRFDAQSLAEKSTNGRRAILSGLKELREFGYVETHKFRLANGKFGTKNTLVDATPLEGLKPHAGTPPPESAERALLAKDKTALHDKKYLVSTSNTGPKLDPEFGKVVRAWEDNHLGLVGPTQSDRLHELIEETSIAAVLHGIDATVERGISYGHIKYVAACAKNYGKPKPDFVKPEEANSVNPIFIN